MPMAAADIERMTRTRFQTQRSRSRISPATATTMRDRRVGCLQGLPKVRQHQMVYAALKGTWAVCCMRWR